MQFWYSHRHLCLSEFQRLAGGSESQARAYLRGEGKPDRGTRAEEVSESPPGTRIYVGCQPRFSFASSLATIESEYMSLLD